MIILIPVILNNDVDYNDNDDDDDNDNNDDDDDDDDDECAPGTKDKEVDEMLTKH